MRTNTVLFVLLVVLCVCGVCWYAKNAQEGVASVMSTDKAIKMLQEYDIIDRFASGETVTSVRPDLGKEYRQNPINAISKDLLYHFMMYQDGVEKISDYPYIDTIIELYRHANTEQEELLAQESAKSADDMNAGNQEFAGALLGGTRSQNNVKALKRLPVRCLEAFAAEGCVIKDFNVCADNLSKVKPMDNKLMMFLCTKGIAGARHLLNAEDNNGRTPLIWTARYSTAKACKTLINAGADVNARDNDGNTPLMWAAIPPRQASKYSKAKVCKTLIDAGADVNAENDKGWTPLMNAALGPTAEVCKTLIDAGADVNAKDNNGWTPLMMAGSVSTAEVCKTLIDAGADVNAKDNSGQTPLMYAVTPLLRLDSKYATAEVCKTLIDAGADVNAKDNFGWTPLMRAAHDSTATMACKTLIDAGADVNAEDKNGHTPLMSAVYAGNDDIVGLLLQNGADMPYDTDIVCSNIRRRISNPIEKKELINVYSKGKHKYHEVLALLKRYKNK